MRICLCGSTKFKPQWEEANRSLTLDGHVVYSVAMMTHADGLEVTEAQKDTLDLVHKMKILNSDAVVLVTDDAGYIGSSTKSELQWAEMHGLPIFSSYLTVPPAFTEDLTVAYMEGEDL